MDMKKILQAFDGAASKKPVAGANDMKRFLSVVLEGSSNAPVEERVITGFEEGSVGGDANSFLLSADRINDLVMSEIDKVKINADQHLLKDLMSKFNAFMTAYHAVGKEILQPDLFDDTMGESALRDKEDLEAKRKALQDLSVNKDVDQKAVQQRKLDLEKEARAKGFAESIEKLDEAGYGHRDAYQRDYDSSVSGMGHKDSLAYRMDGGANDEGEPDEPRRPAAPRKKAMYFYNVKPGQEDKAYEFGLSQTRSGKWYSTFDSPRANAFFGQGKVWIPKESLSFTDYFNLVEAKKGLE